MSLEVTLGTVGFVCQLQAAGYPRRAYFSYTYYEIGEWVHCSLEEPRQMLLVLLDLACAQTKLNSG